jgi:hypothetical protein
MMARVLACLLFAAHALAAPPVVQRVPSQAAFTLAGALTDLSALVWTGGDAFHTVSDKQRALLPLTLRIDRATGAITRGEFGAPIPVPTKHVDFEGLAYVAAMRRFYLCTESPPGLLSFRPGDPAAKTVSLPAVFSRTRRGLALESLTWNATVKNFWLANEEALTPDGPVSDAAAGTLVRLLRLDANLRPLAQYAWRTEPATMRFGPGNGVSDLLLLPSGTLLVMERGFGPTGLLVRLYAADFSSATDVAKLPALAAAKFVAARKIPLFTEPTGFVNFEGLTLGPPLLDGTRSLILLADSHGGTQHTFLPLKIRGAEK